MKVSGLEDLQRILGEFQRALQDLDGSVATLSFNPADPRSLENAIREMEEAVDQKAAPYAGNPFVSEIARATKEAFRRKILDRASL